MDHLTTTPEAEIGKDVVQVWSLDPHLARKIGANEARALSRRFGEENVTIVPMRHATNIGIYANDPSTAARLARWMRKFAPLASYQMMTESAISN